MNIIGYKRIRKPIRCMVGKPIEDIFRIAPLLNRLGVAFPYPIYKGHGLPRAALNKELMAKKFQVAKSPFAVS